MMVRRRHKPIPEAPRKRRIPAQVLSKTDIDGPYHNWDNVHQALL